MAIEVEDEDILVDSDLLSAFEITDLNLVSGDYPITIDSEGNYTFEVDVTWTE